MRHGQRLVGVELHAERPGESAAFYAWLLGPGSGGARSSWMPVSLLFEHAICGVHATEPGGPPPSWVPVIAVEGEGARERAAAEGMRIVDLHDRTYLVDRLGVWTRLVDHERLSPDIDPDAMGNTITELNAPDPGETLVPYARVLQLELVEMLDDVADYHMLLDDGVLALGGLWYSSQLVRPLPQGWLVYFDVADAAGTVERAQRTGVEVAAPLVQEDWNLHGMMIDPFGTPFGFCTYTDLQASRKRVRRPGGEVSDFRDTVKLLVDPTARGGS